MRFYRFNAEHYLAEGDSSSVDLLGGKGANLCQMSSMHFPVPAGYTIPTTVCQEYMTALDRANLMDRVMSANNTYMQWLKGTASGSMMVSVRSGAPVSMPGMMDTILNVGMNDTKLPKWKSKIGARAALDCYRRLIQMMGCTAFGIDSSKFEALLTKARFANKVTVDSEIPAAGLEVLVKEYKELFNAETGKAFPQSIEDQLRHAIEAVFASWNNQRAIDYRNLNGISHDMGTAVTIQRMTFGNYNDKSGSGVVFTRNPSTGENKRLGEFLPNAQGEDVVAGIRTPMPLAEMATMWPNVAASLDSLCNQLENNYKDMMDVEFTVENGKLYMLQCRVGKRSDQAAVVITHDFMDAGVITKDEALERLNRRMIRNLLQVKVSPKFTTEARYTGIAANVGIAKGIAVGSAKEAVESKVPCILVTHETDPDDFAGMVAAVGVLTQTGGATSHAAVVARAIQKPCIVGCSALDIASIIGKTVTIDGSTGRVWVDVDVPTVGGDLPYQAFRLAERFRDNDSYMIAENGGNISRIRPLIIGWDGEQSFKYGAMPDRLPSVVNNATFGISTVPSGVDQDIDALFDTKQEVPAYLVKLNPNHTVIAVGEAATVADSMNLKVIGEHKSLEAMLDAESLMAHDTLISKIGKGAFKKLLPILEAQGFSKNPIKAVTPVYALMSALAE